jgi:phosphonate transport system permease protein
MTVDLGSSRTTPPFSARQAAQWSFFVAYVLTFLWSWNRLNMSVFGFFSDLSNVGNLFKRMWPPDFSEMSRITEAMFETVWMALLGTIGAVILSYPLALAAAHNTTPNRAMRAISRGLITLSRAVPEIILAAIFVAAFGPGPFPGILALALHSIGMIGRLFADAIETASEAPREAVVSVGTTKRQTIRSAILPQAIPSMIATSLFRFEINLRGSAILGLVGAGGIGQLISEALETIQYRPALAAVAVLFVVILAIEIASTSVRRSLIGEAANIQLNSQRRSWLKALTIRRDSALNEAATRERRITPPWTSERLFRVSMAGLFAALFVVAVLTVEVSWFEAFKNIGDITIVLKQMFPPSFAGERSLVVSGLVESFAIAVVATTLGVLVALPLGVLMARNINVRRWASTFMRMFALALRGIPELIIAVIFVSAMGLGAVPGTLALSVTVAVFGAKLFADTLEEVSPAPREAVVSVGASRLQEFVSSVIPQFVSPFVAQFFYLLDVFFRSSTVLGIVGGGGIGFLLLQSIRVFEFQLTTMIILGVFVIVLAIEWLGLAIRRLYR